MEDKKLVVKFEVTAEIDTSNMEGDTFEEKLENWKNQVDLQLFDSLDPAGQAALLADAKALAAARKSQDSL